MLHCGHAVFGRRAGLFICQTYLLEFRKRFITHFPTCVCELHVFLQNFCKICKILLNWTYRSCVFCHIFQLMITVSLCSMLYPINWKFSFSSWRYLNRAILVEQWAFIAIYRSVIYYEKKNHNKWFHNHYPCYY